METKLTWNEYKSLMNGITQYNKKLTRYEWFELRSLITYGNKVARRSLHINRTNAMLIEIINEPEKEILSDIAGDFYYRSLMSEFLSRHRDKDMAENPQYEKEILRAYDKIIKEVDGTLLRLLPEE